MNAKKSMVFYLAIFPLIFLSVLSAEDKCSKLKGVGDFKIDKLDGTWYLLRSYLSDGSEGICTKMTITKIDGNNDVTLSQKDPVTMDKNTFSGLTFAKGSGDGNISLIDAAGSPIVDTIIVLTTDYDNYLVFVNCHLTLEGQKELVWIFGKKTSLNSNQWSKVEKSLEDNKIKIYDYTIIDQNSDDCKEE